MAQQFIKPNPFNGALDAMRGNRNFVFGAILVTALLSFELFNYSTTDYALSDLLGDLTFLGLRWSTILAIAFCGIDFAGIARLFSPDMARTHNENWFLFGAWVLAATMNATLTWWGVSLAVLEHETAGNAIIARETMLRAAPVFVAILVWLIRVLIIGTFSVAGDHILDVAAQQRKAKAVYQPIARATGMAQRTASNRPANQSAPAPRPATVQRIPALPDENPEDHGIPAPRPAVKNPLRPASTPRPTMGTAVPHAFSSKPRRYNHQPEPEYTNEDGEDYLEIIEPRYSNAPLAARSSNKPVSGSSVPAEPGSNRNPSHGRKL